MIKVLTIFGTRPEAIKMCPLVQELNNCEQITSVVCVTAQHREMLDQVLEVFNISPDYDLNIMKKNQSLAEITSRVIMGLDEILKNENPDIVLVHGDTTTTMAASLASFYNNVKIGHVEAGLRTFNKYSPFPEEANRMITGVIADFHFAPTKKSKENLLKENKNNESIFITGNTAIDALKTTITDDFTHEIIEWCGEDKLILMTVHRRENVGTNMVNIFKAINKIVKNNNEIKIVYPIHLNPKIREIASKYLKCDRIRIVEPLDVISFHNIMNIAHLIITDSGGIQEEAPSLGKPVVVLRDTTERPEGVEVGTLKLAGTNTNDIYNIVNDILINKDNIYNIMSNTSNPYGDGKASKYIVEILLQTMVGRC